jgi:hypothetical protein
VTYVLPTDKDFEEKYWAAASAAVGLAPDDESRAFCPGASPPDNSCSPANKGTAGPAPPKAPEPAAAPGSLVGDPRGTLTGHTREQRLAHLEQVSDWLASRGIEFIRTAGQSDPPTMHSMDAVTRGIEELERVGIGIPQKLVIADIPGNPPAGYHSGTQTIWFDPDYDIAALRDSVEQRFLAGVKGQEDGGPMIHEMSHHDHNMSVQDQYGDEKGREVWAAWCGNPGDYGPTTDPWEPTARFGYGATEGGNRTNAQRARLIASEVSVYATMNPLEFVAETRTGLSLGLNYSDKVMKLYDDYLGPTVRRPAAKAKKKAA